MPKSPRLPAPAGPGGTSHPERGARAVSPVFRQEREAAYDQQGQRGGRPHVAAWGETEIVLAASPGSGTDDPGLTMASTWPRA
jgi:hypothetical protein